MVSIRAKWERKIFVNYFVVTGVAPSDNSRAIVIIIALKTGYGVGREKIRVRNKLISA